MISHWKKTIFYSDVAQNPLKTMQKSRKLAWKNWKKRFFLIFFKLFQTVSSDVKMVPKCIATLKATPKASGHIMGSFQNFFFRSNSRSSEANVCLRGSFILWKWHFMRLFKTSRLFPNDRYGLNMIGEVYLDHNSTFCRADFI